MLIYFNIKFLLKFYPVNLSQSTLIKMIPLLILCNKFRTNKVFHTINSYLLCTINTLMVVKQLQTTTFKKTTPSISNCAFVVECNIKIVASVTYHQVILQTQSNKTNMKCSNKNKLNPTIRKKH